MITDPGWLDSLTATVDWGDGAAVENVRNPRERPTGRHAHLATPHMYGDDGMFTAHVCAADDDTTNCRTPRRSRRTTSRPRHRRDRRRQINGIATFIAHEGEPVPFNGQITDPGSDDQTRPGTGTTDRRTRAQHLNDPNTDPDPDPSPTINPRDMTDTRTTRSATPASTPSRRPADDDSGLAGRHGRGDHRGNAASREAEHWKTSSPTATTAIHRSSNVSATSRSRRT